MQEVWQPVKGWETRYKVSNLGQVQSLPHEAPNAQGTGTHIRPGKILKPYIRKNGYGYVILRDKDSSLTQTVHMLVALAFLPPCPGPIGKGAGHWQVDHRDEDKLNNTAQNLRWLPADENRRRSCTELTPKHIQEIRRRRANGDSLKSLATMFGKCDATISLICSKKLWAWVD